MGNYQPISLLICDGNNEHEVRRMCNAAWMGFSVDNVLYSWQRDLSSDAIRGRRAQKIFDTIVNLILLLIFITCIAALVYYFLYKFIIVDINIQVQPIFSVLFLQSAILIGGSTFLFLISRLIRGRLKNEFVSRHANGNTEEGVSWESVSKIHNSAFCDMSRAWSTKALRHFEDAILWSNQKGLHCTIHILFWKLLSTLEAKSFIARFELVPKEIERLTREKFVDSSEQHKGVAVDAELWQVVANAYRIAAQNRDPKVDVAHLLNSILVIDNKLKNMFETLGVPEQKLTNGLAWVHFLHRMRRNFMSFRKMAMEYNVSDVGAAMTGLATPLLNSICRDLSKETVNGYLPFIVDRTSELNTLTRVFESGGIGAVLVGPQGVGKMSVIEGLAEAMIEGRVPDVLKNKRLLVIPISQIISGNNPSAYYMRLMSIIDEAVRSNNIVLVFDGIDGICGVRVGGNSGQDLSDTLAEVVERTGIRVIATSSTERFRQTVSGSRLGNILTKIDIQPVDDNTAIQIVESAVQLIENNHDVFFTYDGIVQCVQMARKFLQDEIVPESALKLAQETAVYVRNTHGKNSLVRAEDVGVIVSEKSHIPTAVVSNDEREKLLELEKHMHERVIGQDEAVKAVANALRRGRTNMRSGKRPIATFLFLGPTGVGKTETAKTLAKVYFGGEKRMIRFDMSEFQDSRSVYRLIGEPNAQGTGLLTESVRQQPFSLILLDEFEKADKAILNMFLQIFDDGRLTDSVGKVIDFTNTMIIATSNAGSQFIQDAVRDNKNNDEIKQTLLDRELKGIYSPELLNRFDSVIVFTPLSEEQIEEIAHIMTYNIGSRLYERDGIQLRVTDRAIFELARKGFSPEFGVRPLRRVIQEQIEDKIAEILLKGDVHRNQTIVIDVGGKVTVES